LEEKEKNMRLKSFWGVGLIMILAIVTILTVVIGRKSDAQNSSSKNVEPPSEISKIPVYVKALPAEKNVVPIELKCESAELINLNTLEKLSCIVINHTSKSITSLVVSYTISIEESENLDVVSGEAVVEMLIHPDFYERRKHSFIKPNEETPINVMTTTFDDNSVIRKVEMQIDYVEFEDKSIVGANIVGSKAVAEIRQGAAIYRDWLSKKYIENEKSETLLVELLQNQRNVSRENLGDLSPKQIEGAKVLQKYIRRVFSTEGIETVKALLK
jgi:hypothetical protein